nr:MAG TPA: hypothetical protein [Caudoviricetes sp.]
MYIKAKFKVGDEIKSSNVIVGKNLSNAAAMIEALQNTVGYGDEDYYTWDDPDILKREIISLEIVEE